MFRKDFLTLSFEPKDGMKVLARGGISVYAQRGQYQLIAHMLHRAGIGDILAMLEARKRRFAAEGFFDESKKKPIPVFPERVGVITSPSGAAVRDIIRILHRRNPKVSILILPALVQGEEAAASIAMRIRQANEWNLADVLIVGRGGGSIEDLLPFSDELVVRAIAESHIPVISAVGHETDWALSDYAADLRASTPSAAAEMASIDLETIDHELDHFETVMTQSIQHAISQARQRLSAVSPRAMESLLIRKVLEASQRFDTSFDTIRQSFSKKFESMDRRLVLAINALTIANPRAVMRRGFSIVKRRNNEIVRSATMLKPEERVQLLFFEGEAEASIQTIMQKTKKDLYHEGF